MTELTPGGKDIRVTESNKTKYILLIAEWFLHSSTFLQMRALKAAFYEMIPFPWIAFFNEYELQILLCGVQTYDIEDWKANTVYAHGYNCNSPQCIWFWEFIDKSTDETKNRLQS
ncbi:hypothetical protein MXB_5647 [Myxobolus squamalis]|nr:hypothetical protein MXB_5647 [Myxobolus squamalis]